MTTSYKILFGTFTLMFACSAATIAQDDSDDGFDFGDMNVQDADFADTESDATGFESAVDAVDDETVTRYADPAVNEVILSNPKTADELLRAIDILVNLDRIELAKGYLQNLTDLQLDTTALANLQRRVGSGIFVKLAGTRELNPQAAEFATSALVAASEMQQDPKRLRSIVDQLQAAEPAQHRRLARELINVGSPAVAPMLNHVASEPSSTIAPLLRTSIAAIGKPAIGPLLAYLDSSNANQRAEAVRILGHMRTRRAVPFLVRSYSSSNDYERQSTQNAILQITRTSPNLHELVAFTREVADQRYAGVISIDVGSDGKSDAWVWDAANNAPILNRYLPRDIAMFEAARHYTTLRAYDSTSSQVELRHLISSADAAKTQGGLDVPLSAENRFIETTSTTEPHTVSLALKTAMADGHMPATIGLCEALGHIGDAAILAGFEGLPSPVATAVTHADARIRFAAATAIAKIGPQHAFSGNSHLAAALAHFGSSRGHRGALVGHPQAEVAQTIAGLLNQLGFDADIATTSKHMLKQSADSADYEFFLISDAFARPVTHQLVQLMRQNPLTAKQPIGILARSAEHSDASMIAELHPRVITLPESRDAMTIARAVDRLSKVAGRSAVSAERRGEMAHLALAHLADLAQAKQLSGTDLTRFVHQIRRTSTTRGLADKSIEVLGRTSSPEAQAILLRIASQHSLPIEQRKQAAKAFDESVRQFGVMLTRQQVATQYNVYNGSESLDAPTQQLLGSVLDAIEDRLTN